MIASLIILSSLASLVVGCGIGYMFKGVTITINKPVDEVKTDEEGKPIYNQSLLDLMPVKMREEIDLINKGVI